MSIPAPQPQDVSGSSSSQVQQLIIALDQMRSYVSKVDALEARVNALEAKVKALEEK